VITPAWSPDGQWLAYLRRTSDVTQAWRVRADGSGLRQVTHGGTDVEAVTWAQDGRGLIVQSRPGIQTAAAAIDAEGRSGFLYDDRFVPNNGNRPQVRDRIAVETDRIDVATGVATRASDAEVALVDPTAAPAWPDHAVMVARGSTGKAAWTAPDSADFASPMSLHIAGADGSALPCGYAECHGPLVGLWWSADGRTLYLLRPEGPARSRFGFYAWRVGASSPRRVFETIDVLAGCQNAGPELVCARDRSTAPRQIVAIDPETGSSRLLFDPNPGFAHLRLGTARRLLWKNRYGVESYGDLVLPPGYRPGRRLPLILVQYLSRGFLRGGTGDEFPIQLFAARGFAVLSVQAPPSYAERHPDAHWPTWEAAERADIQGWRDRRSLASTLIAGAQAVERLGIADPRRIGVTGLSDGATTARFALINTHVFAAASISTCCMEPTTSMIYGGEAWADDLRTAGYPGWTVDRPFPSFWRPASLTMNAGHMRTPLLMQVSDDEYLLGLQTFAALRDNHAPVEMHVFPGEHHIKWQPAHRLAIYARNVDWFDYWLNGHDDPDPSKVEQYRRWDALKARERRPPARTTLSPRPPRPRAP
jgi:dipeptidyl aminopeptidase/acylaminoacyl peptidase